MTERHYRTAYRHFSELVTSIQQDASSKTPRKLASGAAAYKTGLQPLHGFLARHMECFRGKLGILELRVRLGLEVTGGSSPL